MPSRCSMWRMRLLTNRSSQLLCTATAPSADAFHSSWPVTCAQRLVACAACPPSVSHCSPASYRCMHMGHLEQMSSSQVPAPAEQPHSVRPGSMLPVCSNLLHRSPACRQPPEALSHTHCCHGLPERTCTMHRPGGGTRRKDDVHGHRAGRHRLQEALLGVLFGQDPLRQPAHLLPSQAWLPRFRACPACKAALPYKHEHTINRRAPWAHEKAEHARTGGPGLEQAHDRSASRHDPRAAAGYWGTSPGCCVGSLHLLTGRHGVVWPCRASLTSTHWSC